MRWQPIAGPLHPIRMGKSKFRVAASNAIPVAHCCLLLCTKRRMAGSSSWPQAARHTPRAAALDLSALAHRQAEGVRARQRWRYPRYPPATGEAICIIDGDRDMPCCGRPRGALCARPAGPTGEHRRRHPAGRQVQHGTGAAAVRGVPAGWAAPAQQAAAAAPAPQRVRLRAPARLLPPEEAGRSSAPTRRQACIGGGGGGLLGGGGGWGGWGLGRAGFVGLWGAGCGNGGGICRGARRLV